RAIARARSRRGPSRRRSPRPAPAAKQSFSRSQSSRVRRLLPSASPTTGAIWAHAIRTLVTDPGLPRPRRHVKIPSMVVPELPPDIAELKERVGRFVESEIFPLEEKIAADGEIHFAAVDVVRRKAREAGCSMLNMPDEAGGAGLSMLGQVALEEESGKATNGLGFAVVD